MNSIEIDQLEHSFPSKKGTERRQVLKGLQFTVQQGDIFGLLGPNGGGKTTLFRILSTILIPTSGTAFIAGIDVVKNPVLTRTKIGVVFQSPSLDKKLTLRENIRHHGRLYGITGTELESRIDDIAKRLRIDDRLDDIVEHLSGGLQRRGEIAKGLIHKPAVLLMDEPGTGLDPGARRDMWDYLRELKKEQITVLLTTHLMEEGDKCDRLAILNHGQCMSIGTPDELKAKIGGDVISIQTTNPAELAEKIKNKFNFSPTILDGTVRLERHDGHVFIPQLVESFPGLVQAVTLGKPTLEDVFVHQTGQHLYNAEAAS